MDVIHLGPDHETYQKSLQLRNVWVMVLVVNQGAYSMKETNLSYGEHLR